MRTFGFLFREKKTQLLFLITKFKLMPILSKLFLIFTIITFLFSCGGDPSKKTETAEQQNREETSDSINELEIKELNYIQAYDKALSLWKIPFEEQDVKTSFGNAHVIVCGPKTGEPLILLHGMNASSTMWYPNIQALSKKHRVYAIDFLLEPGKSICKTEVNSTDQIVSWYYEIFDALQLKKINLLGASRGGWLSLNIALHDQSRINKIALLSPAQAFTWIKPVPKVLSNVTYSISPKRRKLRRILGTMTYDVDKISQVYINQYYIATKEASVNKCILQMTPFSKGQLKSLTLPVLVLIGDNDIINNESSLEEAKESLPNVQTEIIKNAGHFLSIDQSEIVNRKVLDFLNQNTNLTAKK